MNEELERLQRDLDIIHYLQELYPSLSSRTREGDRYRFSYNVDSTNGASVALRLEATRVSLVGDIAMLKRRIAKEAGEN